MLRRRGPDLFTSTSEKLPYIYICIYISVYISSSGENHAEQKTKTAEAMMASRVKTKAAKLMRLDMMVRTARTEVQSSLGAPQNWCPED